MMQNLLQRWTRHEKKVEVMSVRVSERTLTELENIAATHCITKSAVAADFLLLGLALYEDEKKRMTGPARVAASLKQGSA